MSITVRQRKYINAYLENGGHGTKAAIAAGCPENSAHSQSTKWLKNPAIQSEIQKGLKRQKRASEKRAERRGITKERWLRELEIVGFANIDDYVKIVDIQTGSSKRPRTVQDIVTVSTDAREKFRGRAIKRVSSHKHGVTVELHSKQAALETIGKHYGWVKNEVELNLPDSGVKVEVTLPSNSREAKKTEGET